MRLKSSIWLHVFHGRLRSTQVQKPATFDENCSGLWHVTMSWCGCAIKLNEPTNMFEQETPQCHTLSTFNGWFVRGLPFRMIGCVTPACNCLYQSMLGHQPAVLQTHLCQWISAKYQPRGLQTIFAHDFPMIYILLHYFLFPDISYIIYIHI